jgi:hypothetical protein
MTKHHSHDSEDYDWNTAHSDLSPHIRTRLLYTQLNKRKLRHILWEQFKDLILVIGLLALLTSPVWLHLTGCVKN